MVNKYWLWWFPGAIAIPFVLVSPSLGFATLIMSILIMILLKIWGKRTMTRVLYVNDQIDKGVIFKSKITMEDQLQYRRKRMVLNHENVSHYVKTRKLMCLILIPLIIYVFVYANVVWFKDPSATATLIPIFNDEHLTQAAIATSIIACLLLILSALFVYLRCRYFGSCLKEPNKPVIMTQQELTEKEKALDEARKTAQQSGGFISAIAQKPIDEEAVDAAREKVKAAGSNAGMISSIAHADLSAERPQMTRDEKIESIHQAEMEKQKNQEQS